MAEARTMRALLVHHEAPVRVAVERQADVGAVLA